jgi:hypothetical protein
MVEAARSNDKQTLMEEYRAWKGRHSKTDQDEDEGDTGSSDDVRKRVESYGTHAHTELSRTREASRRPGVLDRLLGRTARQHHRAPAESTEDEGESAAAASLVTAAIDEV